MVAVNSLLYFLLSAGLSSNPDQAQDLQGYDPLNGLDLSKLCPPNEQLSNCEAHCQKNCTNFAKPFPCPDICVKGCICNEGLVRASNGKCIQPKQCPGRDTCPRGQHYEQCTAHCQTNCTTLERPLPCPRLCVHGCVCDKGTVRGPKGKCIKPDKCPKKDSLFEVESSQEVSKDFCPPTEEYSYCLAHCQRDCSNWADEDFKCTHECAAGCVCIEGMVRGPSGLCMWPRQCPPMVEEVEEIPDEEASLACPKNEVFSECEAHCQKNCTNWNKPMVCPKKCVKGCVCEKGLVRAQDGKCVLPKLCPGKSVCPKGEHYDQCNAHCQRNCTTWGKPLVCPLMCVHGCVCDLGTVRGPKGKCIKPNQCPKKSILGSSIEQDVAEDADEIVCPKYEHLSACGAHCQKNCTNFDKPMPCPYICVKGCVCDEGYVRGQNGKCVKPEQCPVRDVCPRGEHFDMCQAHCQKNCTNWDKPLVCPFMCVKGCICNEGTVRGPRGRCVKTDKCPKRSFAESQEQDVGITEGLPVECTLEKKVGPCRGRIPRYFFNQETRQCEKFFFGGCEENENNFVTREACVRKCQKIAEPTFEEQSEVLDVPSYCTLEKVTGPCKGYFPRYFFNKETNKCEQFIYGGCEGNENNFEYKRLCEYKCLSGSRSTAEMTSQDESEVQAQELPTECTLEKVKGPCNGNFPRYYFNKETNKCEQFIYGGCPGNENNFMTKRQCERKCLSGSRTSADLNPEGESAVRAKADLTCPEAFGQFPYPGDCHKFITCDDWNPTSWMCNGQQVYEEGVGCRDGAVCHNSEPQQARVVPRVCKLEKVEGACGAYFPRYWFNKETNQCEQFIYGGCQGNENNFNTKAQCERKCLLDSRAASELNYEEQSEVQAEELPTECTLEKKVGPCRGSFPRFYFNKETNKCEKFFYGGCQGNQNNFGTKALCERRCLPGSARPSDRAPREESEVKIEELPTECTLEKVEGTCFGHFPRYFFNKETNQCEDFIYGGCQGNKNNFETKEQCEQKCSKSERH